MGVDEGTADVPACGVERRAGDDETTAAVRAWFEARREQETDDNRRAHLDRLEESLLRQAMDGYIIPLVRDHHVEVETILNMLATFRLRWAVGDPHMLFRFKATDIASFPRQLEISAMILDLAAPLLCQEWAESAHEIQGNGTAVDQDAFERLRASATPRELPATATGGEVDAELLRAQTEVERLEVAGLGSMLAEKGLNARQAMGVASAVLRKAAATIGRLDWANAENVEGRPIYGPHRRQELFVERECASALVTIFEYETERPLYDYVGALLAATFPSLAHWARPHRRGRGEARHARLRDRVKQLIGARRARRRPRSKRSK